jgi:hypothetical protein
MLTDRIKQLIIKDHLSKLTQDEQLELENWENETQMLKSVLEEYEAFKKYSSGFYLKKQKSLRSGKSKFPAGFNRFYKYAAIIILPVLISGLALYYYFDRDSRKPVLPGKEIAVINLSNGEVVRLDAKEAKVLKKDGSEIYLPKIKIYDYIAHIGDLDAANYSTITVPRGGFFNVTLADGTNITLNSMSKMRFPFKFNGKERKVWLEGEACFDVVKDSTMPFIVATKSHEIKVLGTIFNVNSYDDDSCMTTALISGRICLTDNENRSTEYLEAGECFRFDKNSRESVKFSDDVQLYSLWTQGVFKFREKSMEDIVKILKRWYRFEVQYEDEEIKTMKFSALALKEKPLDEVFRILQMTTSFKYSRKGNIYYLYK